MSANGAPGTTSTGLRQFFTARWNGEVPLATLFWRDMLLIGTGLNIAATLAAIALLGAKLPLAVALVVHFALTPYNIFLAFAAWRTAERRGGVATFLWQAMAILWLIAVMVI
jgi:hypothetical protein